MTADPDVMRRMALLLEPVVPWLGQRPLAVQPGSKLHRLDGLLGHPFQISHAVVGAQVKAIDHLVASWNLLFKAEVMHGWASMTIARGALENAATAAWLLSSNDYQERCRRTLRLLCQDLQDQLGFEEMLGAKRERLHKIRDRRARALGKAEALSLSREWVGRKLWWPAILDPIATDLGITGLTPHMMWKLPSGLAHGRNWASLAGLDRQHIEEKDGVVLVQFTAKEDYLYVALGMAVELLKYSRNAQEQDRLAWREH